ncbi:hypothetical protein SAMN03159496_02667 [Rhizobium sp. NFR07]|uniref:hypothetical protein n=1 Tax=Rhizobium sp. NFR07 TaxID=1566262 RepID=UPI0008E55A24|nr:hypothetical protein [Rhizobium sp. NFR07]SFB26811.1 hypothetical protein SAMN03159496_02667 [Rhizobium sp. NFR07]
MTEAILLDLTGPRSHKLKMEAGKGSLSIGSKGAARKSDLLVAPDDVINWAVFDEMRTGSGYDWPRWVYYEGNDTSLFEWTRTRRTEDVTFRPLSDLEIDMRASMIGNLILEPGQHRLHVALPDGLRRLNIHGNPALLELSHPLDTDSLPSVNVEDEGDFVLSDLAGAGYLSSVRELGIRRKVFGDEGFDCASLVEFQNLRSLSLHGKMRNLEVLAELPLETLELRYVPDLTGLPELSTWRLSQFTAWNVERDRGKALQGWVKANASEGDFSVSQLRDKAWFIEEYGLPFGAWHPKSEKAASKAYRLAAKVLAKADDKAAAEEAITQFVAVINGLPGIETSEREDADVAVNLLATTRPDLIAREDAQVWFDAARDF